MMGKGSARRPGEGYEANYDGIFGKGKAAPVKQPDTAALEEALQRALENERARFNGKD